jgi:hypothetical protein
MKKLTEKDKVMLKAFHNEFKNDMALQNAILNYTQKHGLLFPIDAIFEPSIDCVFVCVDDKPVLVVGLPPVSYYPVRETEFTDRYLRQREAIAV